MYFAVGLLIFPFIGFPNSHGILILSCNLEKVVFSKLRYLENNFG